MAEILLRNISDDQRKGFKVACAAVNETMADMLKTMIGCGYDFDENRKIIEYYVIPDLSKLDEATRADKLEELYSGVLFFEMYFWKLAQGSNESVNSLQDVFEAIADYKQKIFEQLNA